MPIRRVTSCRSQFGHPVCRPTGSVPIHISGSTGGRTGGPIGDLRNWFRTEDLGEDKPKQRDTAVWGRPGVRGLVLLVTGTPLPVVIIIWGVARAGYRIEARLL